MEGRYRKKTIFRMLFGIEANNEVRRDVTHVILRSHMSSKNVSDVIRNLCLVNITTA